MLSRYTDFSRLGQGGMGVVYRATDTQLQRSIALKFVTARFGSEDQARARFMREARTAAALNHPSICTIHEIGEVQTGEERLVAADVPLVPGTPYIAMELIEGQPLDVLIGSRGRFTLDQLLDVAIPIAEALAAAHAKAIVHRDLKPANVMIMPDGRPKILDFGLAKVVESQGEDTQAVTETESAALTRQGQVLGTVAYMSPEQAQANTVDSRSDIFSFGVMLYEMAAGERPFRGDTPTSTLAKILETEPRPLPEVRRDLPPELWQVIRRCLRKKPEDRFQSTADLVVALKELRQATASPRGRLFIRLGLAAIVVVAVSLGIFKLTAPRPESKRETNLRQLTSNPTENGVIDAEISPDGTLLAYSDPTGLYLRVIETGETTRVAMSDRSVVRDVTWFPDGTRLAVSTATGGAEEVWVVSVLGGAPKKIRDEGAVGGVSPDGTRIAFKSQSQGLCTMSDDGTDVRHVVRLAMPEISSSWIGNFSPDGLRIVFARAGIANGAWKTTLETVPVSGEPSTILVDESGLLGSGGVGFYWMHDGRVIFSRWELSGKANLWQVRVDLNSGSPLGEPRPMTRLEDAAAMRASATRDGRRIVFLKQRREYDVYVGDLEEGGTRLADVRRLTLDDRDDWPSAWTRDGKSIYFESTRQGTHDIFRQGLRDPSASVVVGGPADQWGAQLSPDGSHLIYGETPAGAGPSKARLLRIPAEGGPPQELIALTDLSEYSCGSLPGAACVLFKAEDGGETFYDLDPSKGSVRKIGHTSFSIAARSVSPDGTRIALAAEGKLWIVNTSDGNLVPFTGAKLDGFCYDVTWAADGKCLFIVIQTHIGWRLFRADFNGHVNLLRDNVSRRVMLRPLPSPDGRYLAFAEQTAESNAWMMEGF